MSLCVRPVSANLTKDNDLLAKAVYFYLIFRILMLF